MEGNDSEPLWPPGDWNSSVVHPSAENLLELESQDDQLINLHDDQSIDIEVGETGEFLVRCPHPYLLLLPLSCLALASLEALPIQQQPQATLPIPLATSPLLS